MSFLAAITTTNGSTSFFSFFFLKKGNNEFYLTQSGLTRARIGANNGESIGSVIRGAAADPFPRQIEPSDSSFCENESNDGGTRRMPLYAYRS